MQPAYRGADATLGFSREKKSPPSLTGGFFA